MLINLTTAQIEAFLALADTLQFSSAAQRCHVSSSAFSQIISRLENDLGSRLFDRTTRSVALTAEGEAFAIGAKRIQSEIDATINEMRARIGGRSGQVTLVATPTPCISWLPGVMRRFREHHPGIALRLHDGVSQRCFELLTEGYADIGVTAQAGEESEFESAPLFDETFHVLCLNTDPLSNLKSVSLDRLRGRDYIGVIGQGEVWDKRKHDLKSAGVRDTGLEVTNFSTLVGLVEAGFGIGLVPRMALPLCHRETILARPIADRTFTRTFYLVKRRFPSLSIAAAKMEAFLARSADDVRRSQ